LQRRVRIPHDTVRDRRAAGGVPNSLTSPLTLGEPLFRGLPGLGLESGIDAYDAYILEAARASGFPLLALDALSIECRHQHDADGSSQGLRPMFNGTPADQSESPHPGAHVTTAGEYRLDQARHVDIHRSGLDPRRVEPNHGTPWAKSTEVAALATRRAIMSVRWFRSSSDRTERGSEELALRRI
jgi:hypothetical protein